jgi:predicted dinucleotide-binding enzyme
LWPKSHKRGLSFDAPSVGPIPTNAVWAALAKERVKAPAEAIKEAEIVVIATPWSAIAGEQIANWAPGAFVFKTLNTTGASNMARAAEYPVKPLMLVAGDEAGKKPLVMELVGMLGFEPVDAGPLKNARLLEPFAMVWIDQAMKRGRGRNFAFALVKMK